MMAILVVDTDVWSYLYKGRAEGKLYQPHILDNILVISFQTQAELLRWAAAAGWGQRRRDDLESRLQNYVVEHSSNALSPRWSRRWKAHDATAVRFRPQTLGSRRPHFILVRH